MNRCLAIDVVSVDDQPLELRCTHWSDDLDGRHPGDHLVHLPPNSGGDHTWFNDNPLSVTTA